MNKLMIAVAALAAAPLAAAPVQAHPAHAATSAAHELTHIRTTLHGKAGPVVVLIPGLSTPGAVWDDTVAALAPTHRLLVVEVKGFDGAAAPANQKSGLLDGVVTDLSADLAARKIGSATVVGHSLGGLLAMKLALAHPAQAKQLLIVDALPFFGTVFDDKATVASVTPRAEQMRAMMAGGAAMMKAAADKARTSPPSDCGKGMVLDPKGACKVMLWSMSADAAVVGQAIYEDMLTDLRQPIAGLKMPVTVLYQAEQDPAASKARYTADYAALPSTKLVPVAKTSHFIMLDRPDAFLSELRAMTGK